MGDKSGGGVQRPKNSREELDTNIRQAAKKFPMNDAGEFGKKGRGSRIIEATNPNKAANSFWRILANHGEIDHPRRGVHRATFNDGSIIVYRPVTSTPRSPAVEISIFNPRLPNSRPQKIHFIRKESRDGAK